MLKLPNKHAHPTMHGSHTGGMHTSTPCARVLNMVRNKGLNPFNPTALHLPWLVTPAFGPGTLWYHWAPGPVPRRYPRPGTPR